MATRYAVMTHSTAPVSGTPKERAIEGRLMLTIEASSEVMKPPVPASTSTAQRLARSWLAGQTRSRCGPPRAEAARDELSDAATRREPTPEARAGARWHGE